MPALYHLLVHSSGSLFHLQMQWLVHTCKNSLATTLGQQLLGNNSWATTPWQQLLGNNSLATTPWQQLLSNISLATTPGQQLLGNNSLATTPWQQPCHRICYEPITITLVYCLCNQLQGTIINTTMPSEIFTFHLNYFLIIEKSNQLKHMHYKKPCRV